MARINIHSVLEPSGLPGSDGKRLDGLILSSWARSSWLIWDATIYDSFAPSHIIDAVVKGRVTASVAEQKKTLKYHWDHSVNYFFQPIRLGCSVGPRSSCQYWQLASPRCQMMLVRVLGFPNAIASPSPVVMLRACWLVLVVCDQLLW